MKKAFTPLEKVQLIKLHLLEQVPVSEVCENNGVDPVQFHQWIEQFFRNGAAVFEVQRGRGRPPKNGTDARVRQLQREMTRKEQVLAELLTDHVALKKKLGLG